ncbi:MAG: hypothetical protein KGJ78_03210 [Alphaproteobacteria bacterium]|nr:hypothetical protein [Alphaproteobacteria bacterium]
MRTSLGSTGVMRGWSYRALFSAAGAVAFLAAASLSVALASNATGASVSRLAGYSVHVAVVVPGASIGPEDPSRYLTDPYFDQFAYDGIGIETGYNTDVTAVLDRYVPMTKAYDGLFYATPALTSPYLNLSSGGSFVGLTMSPLDNLHLTFGVASRRAGYNVYLLNTRLAAALLGASGLPYDPRSSTSLVAGATWDFAKWGDLDFAASQTTEHEGALGVANRDVDTARTTALGVTAHVGFGGGWVTTATYNEGATQLDLRPGALGGLDSSIRTQSYGIAVAKRGLFGNDALGVALAHPAPYSGSYAPGGSNDMQFFGRDKLFAGTTSETDIELGYKTEFFGDSIALQANAAYQMNYGGQNGNNALSLVSRAKIKF